MKSILLRTVIVIVLVFLFKVSYGQNIDSMNQVLQKMPDDSVKLNKIMDLAHQLKYNDLENSTIFFNKGLKLAQKLKITAKTLEAQNLLGSVYANLGKVDSALYFFTIVKNEYENTENKKSLGHILGQIRYVYNFKGDYEKANEYSFKSLAVFEEINDKPGMALANMDIGSNFFNQKRYTEALDYTLKGYQLSKELGLQFEISECALHLGNVYTALNECKTSIKYFDEALELSEEMKIDYNIALLFNQKGIALACLGDYDTALEYLSKAQKKAQSIGYTTVEKEAIGQIGEIYLVKKDYRKAIENLNVFLEFMKSTKSSLKVTEVYDNLSKCYFGLGDFKKAYEFINLAYIVNDSLLNAENSSRMLELQTKYETASKENKINEQLNQIAKQKMFIWGSVAALFLAFLFAYIIFRRYQYRQRIQAFETQKLKELDEFKSKFFTNISHEFRTPITIILGMAEDIALSDNTDLQTKSYIIKRNANNLLKLINQILDLAKLESNTLKLNFVHDNVLIYLKYILNSFQSYAESKNIRLEFETSEEEIYMDYEVDVLLQILHNLLINAINYSNQDGLVRLVANTIVVQNLKYLELSVVDNGMGIPEDELDKIFDRFYQASNIDHKRVVSSGIGLSLTKEFVRVLEGQINVKSELNKWTAFNILLPIRNNAQIGHFIGADESTALMYVKDSLEPVIYHNNENKSDNYSILIIEDNADIVSYLSDCLNHSYNVNFAMNGQEGIVKAFDLTPDIIISDVMMPGKDGLEVLEILKNDSRTSHIPIVLLTAKADIDSKLQGLRYGADAYLTKPFNREELFITLKNLIDIRLKLQKKYTEMAFDLRQEQDTKQENQSAPIYEDIFIAQLRVIVENNLANINLDVEFLCKELGMSKTNLYGKMKALTGLSVVIYIRKMRLHKANELLNNTTMNISQIAYEVGYNDPKFFSKLYADEYGLSPKLAREKNNLNT